MTQPLPHSVNGGRHLCARHIVAVLIRMVGVLLIVAAAMLAHLASWPPLRAETTNQDRTEHPEDLTDWHIESVDLGPLHGILTLPAFSAGRIAPVVIVLNDELDSAVHVNRYVDQLLHAGIATMVVFAEADLVDVLRIARTRLASDDRLDTAYVGALGFGAGGLAVAQSLEPFAARAMVYPGCPGLLAAAAPNILWNGTSVLLMHGSADVANPPDSCTRVAAELRETGAEVRHLQYQGATFAWDHPAYGVTRVSRLTAPGMAERAPVHHWPALAEMSAAQCADFFSTALARRFVPNPAGGVP